MTKKIVDLRSDTITQPTPAMREAMAVAQVGDDVFGEDPTVNRLEALAAQRLGKEAALLVSSGTMGNLVSQLAHCERGDEILLGDQSHVFYYEQGGSSALGGLHPRTLPNNADGTLPLEEIENAIRPDDIHFPRSRLILLENTHNRCNGRPLTPAYTADVARLAKQYGLKLHIDGARIFNAAAALKTEVSLLAKPADSVTFCLSKGLAAPIGSIVCGDQRFVQRARRYRKALGGGMRQAGMIAAAGIVALTEMVDRLVDDHKNAKLFAKGLAGMKGLQVDPDAISTNIVYVRITEEGPDAQSMAAQLGHHGVRVLATAKKQMRAVFNYQVEEKDVDQALSVFSRVVM